MGVCVDRGRDRPGESPVRADTPPTLSPPVSRHREGYSRSPTPLVQSAAGGGLSSARRSAGLTSVCLLPCRGFPPSSCPVLPDGIRRIRGQCFQGTLRRFEEDQALTQRLSAARTSRLEIHLWEENVGARRGWGGIGIQCSERRYWQRRMSIARLLVPTC